MILKPCRQGGCNALTDRKDGRCLKHARQQRNEKAGQYPTSTANGYGKEWQRIRKHKIISQPFCERCESLGLTTLAAEVHHVDKTTSNNLRSNLMSLCKRCHQIIHRGDRFGRGETSEG